MCKHKTSRRGVHWTPALMKLFVLCVCYDVMKIVYSNVTVNFQHLYNLIYQDSFFDRMMASSKGSKMPRGDKKAIMDFQIIVPPISLRCLYSAKVRSFYFYQNKLKIENQTLIDLRDTLLPRLLSGEVDVSGLQGEGIDG